MPPTGPSFSIGPITVITPGGGTTAPGTTPELQQMARTWGVPQDPRLLELWRAFGASYPYAKYDWMVITNQGFVFHELFGQPILANAGDLYGDAFIGGGFNLKNWLAQSYLALIQQTQVGPLKDHFALTDNAWSNQGDPFYTPGAVLFHFMQQDIKADPAQIEAWARRGVNIKNAKTEGSFWVDALRPLLEAAAVVIGAYYGATYLASTSWGGGATAGAGAGAAAAGGAASGGAASAGAGAAAASSGETSAILADVQAFVSQAQKAIQPVADAISSGVHTISTIVNTVNGGLIQPIVGPIASIIQEVGAVKDFIHNDLRGGIQGILAIPGDIAGALTTIDATMQRAVLQLGTTQAQVLGTAFGEYGPSMGSLGQKGIADSFDRVFPVKPGEWKPMGRITLSDPTNVQQALSSAQAIMDEMAQDSSWYARFANYIFSIVDSGAFIVKYNEPYLDLVGEAGRLAVPTARLSAADAVRAWRIGELSESDARKEIASYGFDSPRQDALYELSRTLPSAQDFLGWYNRGLLSQDELTSALSDLGYEQEDIKRYLDSVVPLVDADRSLDWWKRGLVDDATLAQLLGAQGYDAGQQERLRAASFAMPGLNDWMVAFDREAALQQNPGANLEADAMPASFAAAAYRLGIGNADASLLWANHAQLLPPSAAIQSYFRGYINQTQLHAFLRAAGFATGMADNLVDSVRPQIEYRTIPTLVAAGILDAVAATQMLKQHGYSDNDVNLLMQSAGLHKKVAVNTTAAQVQKDTQATIIGLYNNGTVTREEAATALTNAGIDPALVTAMLNLEDIKAVANEHATEIDTVLSNVQAGIMTFDQAQASLDQYGLTTREKAGAMSKLNRLSRTRNKVPSEAELLSMYKNGVIDKTLLLSTLTTIGYSPTWANLILENEDAKRGASTKQQSAGGAPAPNG